MNKNKRIFVPALLCALMLCGCAKENESSLASSEQQKESAFAPDYNYPEKSLKIMTMSEDALKEKINAMPNLTAADDILITVPQEASVYRYTTCALKREDYASAEYQKDFEACFDYFFPDRKINGDYLKYVKYRGGDDPDRWYESGTFKNISEVPDGSAFVYNEMPELTGEWNDPVMLEMSREIGFGGAVVNKGGAVKLAGICYNPDDYAEIKPYYIPLSLDLAVCMHFEYVGTYLPVSEERFRLTDGETRICDAVKNFEDMINNVPLSAKIGRNIRTKVYLVDVYKLNDEEYCFSLDTEPEFRGVLYDPSVYSWTEGRPYDSGGGGALMIRSDDTDIITSYFNSANITDIRLCESIIPPDKAIEAVSEKMTGQVGFEVQEFSFFYAREYVRKDGYINIDTYEQNIKPVWRIVLFNPNDNFKYYCYINADDGKEYRYCKSPASE